MLFSLFKKKFEHLRCFYKLFTILSHSLEVQGSGFFLTFFFVLFKFQLFEKETKLKDSQSCKVQLLHSVIIFHNSNPKSA